jgi:signal transduction histidine kinase
MVPRAWPLTAKVPLLSAAMIFLVALFTTQVALRWSAERESQILARMGSIYLDGISGVVMPYAEAGDRVLLLAALERSQSFYAGLPDRFIEVRWTGPDGTPERLSVGEPGPAGVVPEHWAADAKAGSGPVALIKELDRDLSLMWVFRRMPLDAARAVEVVAALDVSDVATERRFAHQAALIVDLILAALAALIGFFVTKRMVRPLSDLTAELEGGSAATREVALRDLQPPSTEFGRLQRGISVWMRSERDRADLQAHLAEQEKMLLLGKLAAGLAHEVRNPVAGLLNAISTLRRFGDDKAVREETADLLERGLNSIARVADAALSTYREPLRVRPLTPSDTEDLRILVAPALKRRGLRLDWKAAPLPPAAVDTNRLRQILINLLLNACAAARENGTVRFAQSFEAGHLVFDVADDGPGLPSDILRMLIQGPAGGMPSGTKLGLWITLRLADDLGARLSAWTSPAEGTRIRLSVPAETAAADARPDTGPTRAEGAAA